MKKILFIEDYLREFGEFSTLMEEGSYVVYPSQVEINNNANNLKKFLGSNLFKPTLTDWQKLEITRNKLFNYIPGIITI